MSRARYCRCGSPLARDNAGPLCSACQRTHRRDRAPEVPPAFWHTALMGAALASGDLGRVIRMYRFHPFHGRPLTQSAVADWLHVSQATLSRIEHGKRHLTIDEIDCFTRALSMPLALRWTQHPTEVGEDVDPLSRRSLLGAGAGAALGLNATTAATPAAAREIDPGLVSHWTNLLRVLNRHDAMFGPRDVLETVRHELGLIADHRRVARGDLRKQLLSVEARWSEFASWLSNDTGQPAHRDYWGERSLRLGKEAGDPDIVAWVLMRQSQWACNRPEPRQVVTFAEAAARTPGASERILGLCALQEAQGHALANDAAACERRIADAYGHIGDVESGQTRRDDLGRQDLSPPYVLAAEARCWVQLRPRKTIQMLEEALRLWPRDRARGRGIHQARLAVACAAADEPDRAAAEGMKAVHIAQSTRSDLTVRQLRRLDRQFATYDVPAVAGFREAVAAL
jgi:transcriptional regulator with XRE-family HTH domain